MRRRIPVLGRAAFRAAACLAVLAPAAARAQEAAKPAPSPWKVTADLGYVATAGNRDLATLSIGDKATYTTGLWLFTQQFSAVYSEAEGTPNAEYYRLLGRTDFTLTPRLALFASAAGDRNRFAGIRRKVEEQAGVAWKAILLPEDTLNVEAGGGAVQQANLDGSSLSFASGRMAGAYKHAFNASAFLLQTAEGILNLQDTGDYRLNSETSIAAPLVKGLALKLGFQVRYQSRPPFRSGTTTRFLTTDYVFTSGVQVSF